MRRDIRVNGILVVLLIIVGVSSVTIQSKNMFAQANSNILIWINENLMPSTAFSTSFQKLKRRVCIFQNISEVDNPFPIFFPDNYSSWKNKQINLLFIKKSKYFLNYRALKFQYIFNTFPSFFIISQKQ